MCVLGDGGGCEAFEWVGGSGWPCHWKYSPLVQSKFNISGAGVLMLLDLFFWGLLCVCVSGAGRWKKGSGFFQEPEYVQLSFLASFSIVLVFLEGGENVFAREKSWGGVLPSWAFHHSSLKLSF